jgi:hypothetical protein
MRFQADQFASRKMQARRTQFQTLRFLPRSGESRNRVDACLQDLAGLELVEVAHVLFERAPEC